MDVLILEFMSPGDKMLGGNYAYIYYMLKQDKQSVQHPDQSSQL